MVPRSSSVNGFKNTACSSSNQNVIIIWIDEQPVDHLSIRDGVGDVRWVPGCAAIRGFKYTDASIVPSIAVTCCDVYRIGCCIIGSDSDIADCKSIVVVGQAGPAGSIVCCPP